MSRRIRTTTAPKSVAAPAGPTVDLAQLAQLLLALTVPAPAPAPAAPVDDAPALAPRGKAIVARRVAAKAAATAASPKAARAPMTDAQLAANWRMLTESYVGREFSRLTSVKYDTRDLRFRAPTTQERERRATPKYLRPASGILADGPVFSKLAAAKVIRDADADSVLIRNAAAGVEVLVIRNAGKVHFDVRTLDGEAFSKASRGAKLAVTNLLNAMLPA